MNKKKELVINTLIIALGKISTQFISFLLLPLYTTHLSTDAFGLVDLAVTYIALLAPVITIQLEMAAFRFLIDARGSKDQKSTVISSILRLLGLLLAAFIMGYLFVDIFIDISFGHLVVLGIVTTVVSNMLLQFARGLGENVHFAIGGVIAGVTTIVLNVILIVGFQMGAGGMLTAMAVANAVCAIYLFVALRLYEYIDFNKKEDGISVKLLKYSMPLVPNGISWWLISAADRTIISILLGLSANGIFAIAYKFPIIFTSFFSIFGLSWTESASMHIDSKDRNKFFSEIINASIQLFGSLGLILIASVPLAFNVLIDTKYNEAYLYIPILIIGAFFNAIVGLYSAIYIAKKLTKQVANSSMIAALISITLTLVFTYFIGLYAAAIATAVAYLAMSIYRHYDVKKYVTITYEKNIFIILGMLYAFTMVLYYYNNLIGNIVNIVVIMATVLLLNKSIVKVLKTKVFSLVGRRKKLTPEQQASEELL